MNTDSAKKEGRTILIYQPLAGTWTQGGRSWVHGEAAVHGSIGLETLQPEWACTSSHRSNSNRQAVKGGKALGPV